MNFENGLDFAKAIKQNVENLRKTFDQAPLESFFDQPLNDLIQIAFHVSLLAEEGRLPHFRILYNCNPLPLVTKFDPPIDVDVNSLRRLAPTVESSSLAICVALDCNNRLQFIGIFHLREFWKIRVIGYSQKGNGGHVIDVVLSVQGPGHLRACIGTASHVLVLHGGKIRGLRSIQRMGPFSELMNQVMGNLFPTVGSELVKYYGGYSGDESNSAKHWGFGQLPEDFGYVWTKVLDSTLELGHGGVFVVASREARVEFEQIESKYGIKCKHGCRLELGRIFLEWAEACFKLKSFEHRLLNDKQPTVEDVREYGRLHNVCINAEDKLSDTISNVSHLSAMDGCVFLDGQFTVIGFGGEMRETGKSGMQLYRSITDELIGDEKILGYGMRHRSACRFTQSHAGVFVFVISQDKELRLFHSDDERAHRWDDLDALPFYFA